VGGPTEADAARTRVVELNGSSRINGRRMDMARADFEVVVDTTEVWEVRNRSGNIHNLHLHDVQFRVLEYQGRPPPPHLVGLKDTVFLPPGASARLVAEFSDYADASSPYMFHCHLLAHEDNGMMGQFVVVEREQPAALRPPLRHH
jgi:blue copper oxidase